MMSIGELSRRVGIRQSAIRYYESIGLVQPAGRKSGWREYDEEAANLLTVIRSARELGFTLEEISTLLTGFDPDTPPPERWRELAASKLPEIESMIRRASAVRQMLQVGLSCKCVRIEDCFLDDCAGVATKLKRRALPLAQ